MNDTLLFGFLALVAFLALLAIVGSNNTLPAPPPVTPTPTPPPPTPTPTPLPTTGGSIRVTVKFDAYNAVTVQPTLVQGEAHMSFILKDTQQVAVSVEAKSAKGNAAAVQAPTWTVADATLLDVVPSEDGLSATLSAKGPVGTTQVSFTCDADLGEGVKTLTVVDEVTVVAGEAVLLGFKFGAASEITPQA